LWVAAVCVAVVVGALTPAVGLAMVLAMLAPYLLVLGVRHERLGQMGLPAAWVRWLTRAIVEEELELEPAIHPRRGSAVDAFLAVFSVAIVVGASIAMEQAASTVGARHGISEIVIGGLILAVVTSLPNVVAAVYLAQRGRGTATLSTAMNSNALNVAAGLLLPAVIIGLGPSSAPSSLTAAWYLGLTWLALACAYTTSGLRRDQGIFIICVYVAFAGVILTSAYSSVAGVLLWTALPAAVGIVLAARARRRRRTKAPSPEAADRTVLAGWPSRRVWYSAFAISTIIAGIDASLGHHVILIGLLIAGPCCALLTGRWARTASAGVWAIALAILLGLPDKIWGSWMHIAFVGAVAVVAATTTAAAAVIQHSGAQNV
jgi:Ca2+/Na+ antiporter